MTTPSTTALVYKFHEMRDALRGELIERDEEIDIINHALLTRTHVAFIGGPGTGKSMSVARTFERITGARQFHDLVFKASPPETFLGPISIPDLKEKRYMRVTEGFLPGCELVNVEEVFNAGTTLLQSLYMMLEERLFRNNGVTSKIPMSNFFGTSNVMPQQDHDELGPLWDRIHTRKIVDDVSPAGLRQLLSLEIDDDPPPVLTWDEILEAQRAVASVVFTDECADALFEVALGLDAAGIKPTPRRLRQVQGIAKAAAWLDDEAKTSVAHLEPLVHNLWQTDTQFAAVEKVVLNICAPHAKELLEISDSIAERIDALAELKAMDEHDPNLEAKALQLYKKTIKDGRRVIKLEDAVSGRSARVLADAYRRLEQVHAECYAKGFGHKNPPTLRNDIADQA